MNSRNNAQFSRYITTTTGRRRRVYEFESLKWILLERCASESLFKMRHARSGVQDTDAVVTLVGEVVKHRRRETNKVAFVGSG